MHGLAPVRAVTRCRRRGLDRRLAVEFRADRLDALGVRLRDPERLRRDVLELQAAHRAANRFADLREGIGDGAQPLGEDIVDRLEESSVRQECVSTGRSWWLQAHKKKKKK